jgi:hypothetical protein
VGTNHPVHPDTACALVFASAMLAQALETSLIYGDTIQATEDALHIIVPPGTGLLVQITPVESLNTKVLATELAVAFAILTRQQPLLITAVPEIVIAIFVYTRLLVI